MKKIVLLIRPHQWAKNLFIFLPLFFDKRLGSIEYVLPCVVSFFAFSFIASSIYCLNDIWDEKKDKLHPIKCLRPIASGDISKRMGYLIMVIMFLLGIYLLVWLPYSRIRIVVLGIILFYYIQNIAYCIWLKNIAIVDVFIIAIGFVLRVLVGGFATGIWISHWIVLMTFLLALFLAFAKRRDDVAIYERTGVQMRIGVCRYNLHFMNQAISIIAAVTIVCYIMYTVSLEVIERMGNSYLYLTTIWVLAGIMRYLQIAIVDMSSGSPTKILVHDLFIQCCIIGWIISFFVIIYL